MLCANLGSMSRILDGRLPASLAATGMLLVGFLGAGSALGDDLVTLSGSIYHDVRPLRVEPDGVTWEHAGGICKVDFADSPKEVCQSYHYDPAKGAAYHASQVQLRQQTDEQAQQLLHEHEERQRARVQAQVAAMSSTTAEGASMIFRRAASPAASAATKALGEQMAAEVAKQNALAADTNGIGNAKVWSIAPRLGTRHPVYSTDAANADEFKAGIHHSPGGFVPQSTKDPSLDTTQDSFYRPLYLTKSYDDGIDRAKAFASGVPLKQ